MTQAAVLAQMGGQNQTFRNRIINGGMVIDQRNAGASVNIPGSGAYNTVDRFQAFQTTSGVLSIQQVAQAPNGFINSLKVTTTTSATPAATEFCQLRQGIEGFNISDFGWGAAGAQTVTLSFWVRSTLTGSFSGSVTNDSVNRSYPFSYSISSANTWEQKSVTITGDTTGTWLTTNGTGLNLYFDLGMGSNRRGTANTWASADYRGVTGSVSLVGNLNATWQITGVQLEKGSTATPFEQRLYGTELSLCQRYYETMNSDGSTYGVVSAMFNGTSNNWFNWQFKVTKRAAATIALGTGASWSATPTINANVTGSWMNYSAGFTASNTAGNPVLTASAEL